MKKIVLLSLLLGGVYMFSHAQSLCNEPFISEYVEGSMKNQAIEIYNPRQEAISLKPYSIKIYKGGNPNNPTVFKLTGILLAKDVHVCGNVQAEVTLLNLCDVVSSKINFKGTDAVGLYRNDTLIDIIGEIGSNPGVNGWQVGAGSTKDHTLVRHFDWRRGNPYWSTAQIEYDVRAVDDFSDLGSHKCVCSQPTIQFQVSTSTVNEDVGIAQIRLQILNNNDSLLHNVSIRVSPTTLCIPDPTDPPDPPAGCPDDFFYINTFNLINCQDQKVFFAINATDTIHTMFIEDDLIFNEGTESVCLELFGSDPESTIDLFKFTHIIFIMDNDITGIEQIQKNNIGIHPSITSDFIRITGLEDVRDPVQLAIFNGMGQQVYANYLYKGELLDVSSFPSGIYFYHLATSNNLIKIGKVIVMK